MSDILRRIVNAKGTPDNPFTILPDGKVMELTDKGDVFTGYYQNDEGVYYSEADWLTYQREQEAARLAQAEWDAEQASLVAAREERTKKMALAAEKERKHANTKKVTLLHRPFLGIGFLIVITILVVVLWPNTTKNLNTAPDTVVIDTIRTDTIQELFGNAVITGSDVRMRAEPTLQGKIVTFFSKQGERVEIVRAASDSLNWAHVRRENGTTGWVFGTYVKVIKNDE